MKAVQIQGDMSSPRIIFNRNITKPVPKGSEILVRVHAAAIIGDEVLWPEVYATPSRVPGHEISGEVEALGPDYAGSLQEGDEVFGMLAADRGEGQAEFAICTSGEIVRKPACLSHAQAAALPISLLTSMETVRDRGHIQPRMRVLVTGASGAVGSIFLQIVSASMDVHVIALASSARHDQLLRLGATEILDYNEPGWEDSVKDVDVVFDLVGGDILAKTWRTVKEKGTIVTVGDPPPAWAFGRCEAVEAEWYPGVSYVHFIVAPDAGRLREAVGLVEDGRVGPLAVRTFSVEEAEQAWRSARERNRRAKVVIEFVKGDEA